jgi:hydroxylamine reductase
LQGEVILSPLIGLTGAIGNNAKTPDTDRIVHKALLGLWADNATQQELAQQLRQEKFRISPSCATCPTPCGNTSDYDVQRFHAAAPELQQAQLEVVTELYHFAQNWNGRGELPQVVYKAIAYLGYELEIVSYQELKEELKNAQKDYSY